VSAELQPARDTLLAELREHALVIGEVTLSSGQTASYYVDARRALLRPAAFRAAGELIVAFEEEVGAEAVGGPATAAIPLACAAIATPAGSGLVGFFVRGERKEHGLQRWVEGPVEPGARCLVVEDTVTTGDSTVRAIERMREEGLKIVGALCVVDRLAIGAETYDRLLRASFGHVSSRGLARPRPVGSLGLHVGAVQQRFVAAGAQVFGQCAGDAGELVRGQRDSHRTAQTAAATGSRPATGSLSCTG